jgi:hypothetical protein
MANIHDAIFDAMLKEAVAANFRAKMEAMPPEDEILREHPFSERHNRRMNALFAMERRQHVTRKMFAYAKAAVIFICIAATLTAALLMTNPQVRAAVHKVIVDFFEGFTRVEFTEPHDQTRNAWDFSPQYIPDGYELIHSEVLGFSYFAIYESSGGDMLMFGTEPPDVANVNNEFHRYFTEIRDGITYHVHEAIDEGFDSNIVWIDEGFMFSLIGGLPINELLDMAYSVEYTG